MKKTIIYIFLCIFVIVFVSVMFFEILLKTLPFVYRLIPTDNNIQYVYVLGESTAVGAPYEKISYSKILKAVTKNYKINNKEIKLIHLEEAGCQLYHQYINYVLYRYLHPTHRGIMLLYIGTNNWAKEDLYSDFKRNLLLNSEVYKLLDKYIKFLKFNNYNIDYDFQYEYEKIVLLAKKFGDDIYISTISGNYEFPPDGNDTIIENKEIDDLFFNNKIEQAKQLCINLLEDKKYQDKCSFWYRLGIILKQENRISDANEALFNSAGYKVEDKPNPIYQNNIIRKLARKYNIPLFDFFENLCKSGKIIGFDFFIDTVHPNINTHIDIAYGFIDLLSKKYEFDFVKKEDLNVEELKKILEFNNNDMARVIMSRIVEFRYRNLDTIKFNKKVYLKWKKNLEEIEVNNNLLPNREYIDNFLEFEERITDIKNSEILGMEVLEQLNNKLDTYIEQTFSSRYFNFVNFGTKGNSKLKSI